MPNVTACNHCQAKYSVPETAVGKQAKCAKCGKAFVVAPTRGGIGLTKTMADVADKVAATAGKTAAVQPQPAKGPTTAKPQPKPIAQRLTTADIAAGFTGQFERSRLPLTYRFGVLLAAVVMVALVLVYVGLIALAGYATYYHAVNNTWIMGERLHSGRAGRGQILLALVYLAPLFIGPVVIFFMLKPLLAQPSRRERSRSLTRDSEPLLFAFVDRVCETVGAPRPKRIDVDCQVNAFAGFRRGVWSMLGNDLVLTIGLPFMGALTVREFGGVLAHEFAHFAQGAGMRLSYLVQSISHWFVRVVYQRDAWDEQMAVLAGELDIRIGWVVMLAQLGVMIGRGVLWVLMHVGFLVTGVLVRQMEFDADRTQARFAGSDAVASTMRKLRILGAASQLAQVQADEHLDEKRLVDDFPGLVQLNARTMPPETAAEMEKEAANSTTSWFDTHPCHRERLDAATKLASPGVFRLDRSARELLNDFALQSKATTWDMYLALFGPKVPRDALVPVAEFARAAKSRWRDPNDAKRPEHYRYQ